MPELPEVETIVRLLAPGIEGKRILSADLRLPRLLLGSDPGDFNPRLEGLRLERIVRRGKYIILELPGLSLVVHLGMTGQLTYAPPDASEKPGFYRTVTGMQKALGVHPIDKHTHLIVRWEDGSRVLFRDPRTFGKLFLIEGRDWMRHPRLRILGEEPLTLRIEPFLAKHYPDGSARSIKALLLDQSFLSGVGNIYADEALFRSGIHPARKVKDVKPLQRPLLLQAVKDVLRAGIKNSGTSFSDYRKPDGTQGSNFERLQVYGRGGQPCRKCGAVLRKTGIAQRGTVFCPRCQPLPKR